MFKTVCVMILAIGIGVASDEPTVDPVSEIVKDPCDEVTNNIIANRKNLTLGDCGKYFELLKCPNHTDFAPANSVLTGRNLSATTCTTTAAPVTTTTTTMPTTTIAGIAPSATNSNDTGPHPNNNGSSFNNTGPSFTTPENAAMSMFHFGGLAFYVCIVATLARF
ncbi:hypothetical protein DdX_10072 [Ditylenchus destructor]|uniref:Uncharacterized protein n=1 Tax=Ditylenchus destructor TaxID=166010 RepID=A0AAD4N0Q7_9BILA|nr:hypothetical protein DdX_10072 [Ditylenchus destructor]